MEIDFSDMEIVDSEDIATPKFSGDELGMIVLTVEIFPTPPNNQHDIAICVNRADKEFVSTVQSAFRSFFEHVGDAGRQFFDSTYDVIADVMNSLDAEWCFVTKDDTVPKSCRYLGMIQI